MRVVSFRDGILWPAFSRMGYDPTVDLLKDLADASARYINYRARNFWDFADWPELTKTEPRNPVNHLLPYDAAIVPPPNWTNTQTFNKDQIARDPNNLLNLYISTQNANTGNALTNTSFWQPVLAWNPSNTYLAGNTTTPSLTPTSLASDPISGIVYVAVINIQPSTVVSNTLSNQSAWQAVYTQQQPPQNLTNIGRILKVYPVDPRLSDGPFDISFREYDTVFHVGFFHGTTVWVKFMTRPNQYTCTVWSSTTTYQQYSISGSITDLVYDPNTGENFASAQPGNTNHVLPTSRSNNAWWNWVPVPFVIAEALWHGLYADLLRDDGQMQTAAQEEQLAMAELKLAVQRNTMTRYDRITDQQTGVPRDITQPVAPAA